MESKVLKFKKRFGKRKKTNPKRGLFLIVLLALALFLFFNIEKIIAKFL